MAGTIAGTVIDIRNNMPIDGATVGLQPGAHSTTTNDQGAYSMPVDTGTYTMEISKSGYDPWTADGVFVMDDVTTTIKAALHAGLD